MDERTTNRGGGRRYRGRHRQPTRPVARTAVAGTTAGLCLAALPVVGSVSGQATAEPASAAHNPAGHLHAALNGQTLRVWGKATDPDTTDPVSVRVILDGRQVATAVATGRGDTFAVNTPVGYGSHLLTTRAVNIGEGTGDPSIGSRGFVADDLTRHNPTGRAYYRASGRTVMVTGWAIDSDDPDHPQLVRAFSGGRYVGAGRANGRTHRFVMRATVPYGSAPLSVVTYNIVRGTANSTIGRKTVSVARPAATYSNDASGNQRLAASMLASYGWGSDQMDPLIKLWSKESGWRTNAANPSGAYGIPQALPGSKMASAGSDWQSSARTQIAWGLSYIKGRYGSPAAAWAHSVANNWY